MEKAAPAAFSRCFFSALRKVVRPELDDEETAAGMKKQAAGPKEVMQME